MGEFQDVDSHSLREWLEHVRRKETVMWIMTGIAYDEGVSVDELASWYDQSEDEIRSEIEEFESSPIELAIAEREGIDFEAIGESWGLSPSTIRNWFEALEERPVEEVADIIQRYSQQGSEPVLTGTESRVHYLNYDVLTEQEWAIDDDDLFEKASELDLDSDEYGRFLVEPGETILEAAENRGLTWPYACRGGACANCAVIVKEGDVAMPGQIILSRDQVQLTNARLTCVGVPVTSELKLIMNVQHLDEFDEVRLPSPLSESEPAI